MSVTRSKRRASGFGLLLLFAHSVLCCLSPPVCCVAGANEGYAVPTLPSSAAASAASSAAAAAAASALPPGVGLDLDDYLQGLTALPKELCRLCVNCVRVGNYAMPRQISAFISELYSGFRLVRRQQRTTSMRRGDRVRARLLTRLRLCCSAISPQLNLRNDALRRKFDGIKYDLQKIEEVLYDMTVRGLGTDKEGTTTTAGVDTKTMVAGSAAAAPTGGDSAMQS